MDDEERAALTAINQTLNLHDELFDQMAGKVRNAMALAIGSGLIGAGGIFFTFKAMKAINYIANAMNEMAPVVQSLMNGVAAPVQTAQPVQPQTANPPGTEPVDIPAEPVQVKANIQPRIMPDHLANGASTEPVIDPGFVPSDVAPVAEAPMVAAAMEATADAAALDEMLRPQI